MGGGIGSPVDARDSSGGDNKYEGVVRSQSFLEGMEEVNTMSSVSTPIMVGGQTLKALFQKQLTIGLGVREGMLLSTSPSLPT